MKWVYIDLFANVADVENIPVLVSDQYMGECCNGGFRCTGAISNEVFDRDELRAHVKSYIEKVLRRYL